MGIPHKHAAIIKAWADGAEIESSIDKGKTWDFVGNPHWHPSKEYRVKPKPPVKKYHYAYENNNSGKHVTQCMYTGDEDFLEAFDEGLALKWFQRLDNSVKEFPAI